MTPVFLIFLIVTYAINRTSAYANGHILLGVTLPYDALKDSGVTDIVIRYKKAYKVVCLVFLILILPMVFIGRYISVTLMYFLIWVVALFYVNQKTIAAYFNELYTLKQKREWWIGSHNIISVDTEVSRLKNTFPVAKKWFVIPFVITVIPIAFALFGENAGGAFWILQACALSALLIIFYIYLLFNNAKTTVYSNNTEVNITLNRVYKREWTRCFVLLACVNSVIFTVESYLFTFDGNLFVASYCLKQSSAINLMAIIFMLIILSGLFIVIPILYAHNKIRSTRNRLLRLLHEEVFTDDDEYWVFGAFAYNNPNDSRTVVEKRIGYGMTVNMASRSGKVMYAILAGAIILVAGLAFWFIPLDFGSISTDISQESVKINAPMYRYKFSPSDIKTITLIDDIPKAAKTNGASTGRFLSGYFNVSGYGPSRIYVYRDAPPYIAIELENGRVFTNGRTQAETEALLEELQICLQKP
jgi:uncharacterized membrane protein